jgi:predicted XRE-type DNA-binding protein
MTISTDADDAVRCGTANLFADLGHADADAHLLKAKLVRRIHHRIDACGLIQVQAAKLMDVSQPDVSRMLRGHFRDFSVERLMRFLTALGCEVDIVVRSPGEPEARADTIHLQPAQP